MAIKAHEIEQGSKARFRPTRPRFFDLRGRAWFTRSTEGKEKKWIEKMRKKGVGITCRQSFVLQAVDRGCILMRHHCRPTGCKTTQSEWCAVPANYVLREVRR